MTRKNTETAREQTRSAEVVSSPEPVAADKPDGWRPEWKRRRQPKKKSRAGSRARVEALDELPSKGQIDREALMALLRIVRDPESAEASVVGAARTLLEQGAAGREAPADAAAALAAMLSMPMAARSLPVGETGTLEPGLVPDSEGSKSR